MSTQPDHPQITIVKNTIADYNMFQPHDSVLAGVSGGPDSVALLYILLELSHEFPFKLGVAHLNHCLRGQDSDNDAEFVTALAKKLNLSYYIKKADVRNYQHTYKLSLEEAARHVRYAFFDEIANTHQFNKIALGHNADDNAELVLMYLLRGSGTTGISGIPAVRNGKIVRPLIRLARSEIINFVTAKGLKYVTDTSNNDIKFIRNKIRHQLIPNLKASYNPKIIETLNRFSAIISSEAEWMEEMLVSVFNDCVLTQENGKIVLSVQHLHPIHIAAKRRIIRKAIASVKGDLRRITYAHIEAILHLMENRSGEKHLDLPDNIRVLYKNQFLVFSKAILFSSRSLKTREKAKTSDFSFEYTLTEPGILFIKEIRMELKFECLEYGKNELNLSDFQSLGNYELLDMDKLKFPLTVRNFKPGDRFTPLGMSGTQKIKKYFINNKIPKHERAFCPVVLSQGKIIWVVGHRIDESVKITDATRRVLKVEFSIPCL